MTSEQRRIKARLAAAARRWEWEDRQRGITYYRGIKPVRQAQRRVQPAMTWEQFAIEAALVVAAGVTLWMIAAFMFVL